MPWPKKDHIEWKCGLLKPLHIIIQMWNDVLQKVQFSKDMWDITWHIPGWHQPTRFKLMQPLYVYLLDWLHQSALSRYHLRLPPFPGFTDCSFNGKPAFYLSRCNSATVFFGPCRFFGYSQLNTKQISSLNGVNYYTLAKCNFELEK